MRFLFCFFLLIPFLWPDNGHAQAQLPVKQEPRHRNVFENGFLRILDVHIPGKDTTLFHLHATPSVIVIFTNSRLSTEVQGESPVSGHTVPGSVTYAAFDASPVFHRVINNDTAEFHVMDIELLGKAAERKAEVYHEPDIIPAWQENRVNTYTIYAESGQVIKKSNSPTPMLLICITGSGTITIGNSTSPAPIAAGNYFWIDRGNGFQLTGQSIPGSGYVLLDLNQ
jgi:hypothetical protein